MTFGLGAMDSSCPTTTDPTLTSNTEHSARSLTTSVLTYDFQLHLPYDIAAKTETLMPI